MSRINPVPRIDTYLFKIHSNIILPSVKILKALLPSSILATCLSTECYNLFFIYKSIWNPEFSQLIGVKLGARRDWNNLQSIGTYIGDLIREKFQTGLRSCLGMDGMLARKAINHRSSTNSGNGLYPCTLQNIN